jgi:hypothetical protein
MPACAGGVLDTRPFASPDAALPGGRGDPVSCSQIPKKRAFSGSFAGSERATFTCPYGTVNCKTINMACQHAKALTQSGDGQVIFPSSDFAMGFGCQESFEYTQEFHFIFLLSVLLASDY